MLSKFLLLKSCSFFDRSESPVVIYNLCFMEIFHNECSMQRYKYTKFSIAFLIIHIKTHIERDREIVLLLLLCFCRLQFDLCKCSQFQHVQCLKLNFKGRNRVIIKFRCICVIRTVVGDCQSQCLFRFDNFNFFRSTLAMRKYKIV